MRRIINNIEIGNTYYQISDVLDLRVFLDNVKDGWRAPTLREFCMIESLRKLGIGSFREYQYWIDYSRYQRYARIVFIDTPIPEKTVLLMVRDIKKEE